MFVIQKRMEIAYAHHLNLPYESKCRNIHGHNGIVTVYCKAQELDPETEMVIDFTILKKQIHDKLDHGFINEILPDINPTAEGMAKWICDTINGTIFNDDKSEMRFRSCICYRVDFQESEGNIATYILDEEAIK